MSIEQLVCGAARCHRQCLISHQKNLTSEQDPLALCKSTFVISILTKVSSDRPLSRMQRSKTESVLTKEIKTTKKIDNNNRIRRRRIVKPRSIDSEPDSLENVC